MIITAAPTRDTMGELGALDGENLVLVPGMPVPLDTEHYGYALGLGLSKEARARLAGFRPHIAHFTVCDLLGMDGVQWAKENNVAMVGTWHSNYCDYVKFYSAAWWLTPVLRRYIQQFYGAIPTTFVPTDYMRLKLTGEGYDHFTDMQVFCCGCFPPALTRRRVADLGPWRRPGPLLPDEAVLRVPPPYRGQRNRRSNHLGRASGAGKATRPLA
jgi:hypothetical protein